MSFDSSGSNPEIRHTPDTGGNLWKRTVGRVGAALLNGLFPPRCGGCQHFWTPPLTLKMVLAQLAEGLGNGTLGGPLPPETQRQAAWPQQATQATANWFCPACREGFTWVTSPFCTSCGRMFPARTGHNHLCPDCTRKPPNHRLARTCGVYDGSLKSVIHRFKYKGQVQWADPLGLLLYLAARGNDLLTHCDLILPVPLHITRLRQRGFNPAGLMLRQWNLYADRLDTPGPLPPIDPHLLHRRRPTIPQTGLAPRERAANVRGAFQVKDPGNILTGKQVLLVDDVYTTGATAKSCVQALKSEGKAAEVSVLTLAGTL